MIGSRYANVFSQATVSSAVQQSFASGSLLAEAHAATGRREGGLRAEMRA